MDFDKVKGLHPAAPLHNGWRIRATGQAAFLEREDLGARTDYGPAVESGPSGENMARVVTDLTYREDVVSVALDARDFKRAVELARKTSSGAETVRIAEVKRNADELYSRILGHPAKCKSYSADAKRKAPSIMLDVGEVDVTVRPCCGGSTLPSGWNVGIRDGYAADVRVRVDPRLLALALRYVTEGWRGRDVEVRLRLAGRYDPVIVEALDRIAVVMPMYI